MPDGSKIVDDELGPKKDRAGQRKRRKAGEDLPCLRPAECVTMVARPYVIKGLVARGDHVQFLGAPGSGKSLLGPLAGYSIAQGVPFLGRRVLQGPVLYLSAEDGQGMVMRVRALYDRMQDAPDFILMPESIDLMNGDSGDFERVLALIHFYRPVCVIIDTVARAFPGVKENTDGMDGLGRVVTVARYITQEECQPAVITIHHVAKDGGATPRGHGILFGDLDMAALIEGDGANPRTVRLLKNRNGPSDACFTFGIGVADFGPDADGDPITAPYAEPKEHVVSDARREKEAKLNDAPAVMLRELRILLDTHGEPIKPGPDYPAVRAVTRNLLRSRLIDRGWFAESLLGAITEGSTKLADKGYSLENTSLNAIKRKGLATFNRDYVWLL